MAEGSPDAKWMNYSSDEAGSPELYVTSFPAAGARWQISTGGVTGAAYWSPDGKSIRYPQSDKIYDVDVHINGDKPEFSAPKELLTLPPNLILLSIMPDGKRILAARPTGDDVSQPINLVLNWQHQAH